MENIFTYVIIAITTFAITNIDDIVVLTFLFLNPAFKKRNIILGQYAGILALILISLIGLILGTLLEPRWIGLFGFLPIFIGVRYLVQHNRGKAEEEVHPQASNTKNQFLKVALITIANGGDNIGVYTPLFATTPSKYVIIYILIFILMIGIWCALAFYFVKHPLIKNTFAKSGHIILPFFLILLGTWILVKSEALSFF